MILVDTNILVAAARANDDDHETAVGLVQSIPASQRYVPSTVVAETAYLLQTKGSAEAEVRFFDDFAAGDFQLAELVQADLARIAELTRQYIDLPLGGTDASVIAIAERLGIDTVATFDRRHFTVVRPNHVDALTLLPL